MDQQELASALSAENPSYLQRLTAGCRRQYRASTGSLALWRAQLLGDRNLDGESVAERDPARIAYGLCFAGYIACYAAIFLTNNLNLARTIYWAVLGAALFFGFNFARAAVAGSVIFWAGAVYLLAMGVSSFGVPGISATDLDLHFRLIPVILSFFLVTGALATRSPKAASRLLLACGAVVAVSAAINMTLFFITRPLPQQIESYRLLAVLGMPEYRNSTNISATYAIYFAGAAAAAMNVQVSRLERFLFTVIAAILLCGVLVAQARSAYVGVAAAAAVMACTSRTGRRALLLALVAVAGVVALPATRELLLARGMSYRPEVWSSFIALAEERPLLGFGILHNISRVMSDGYVVDQPHNLILSAEVRGGIAGAVAMLTMLIASLYSAARDWSTSGRLSPLSMIVAMTSCGMFDYQLLATYPTWPWVTFWFPIALCIGAEMRVRRTAHTP